MSLVDKYQSQIFELQGKVDKIQKSCPHPQEYRIILKLGANTDNYDPSSDWYYVDLQCGSKWIQEQ